MLINIIWALYLFRAKSFTLMFIVLVSGSAFAYFTFNHNTADIGATWPTYLGGLSRAVFGFFAGSMIWRSRAQPNKPVLYAILPFLVLIGILFAPDMGPFFDVVVVVAVFPAIVFIASCADHRFKIGAFNFLGNISFPLYVVHVPLLMFSAGVAKFFDVGSHIYIVSTATVLTCILSSILLDKYYDRQVRRNLTKKMFEEGQV
jgi:peptidoglycan/LPS O-acetylase OafA/YrhL